MLVTVAAIVVMAFLATFIQRVSGFGFGIAFMSVIPFVMTSYGEATALSGMLAILCALFTGIKMFKYVDWKKLFLILAVFITVSFFAVRLVSHVDNSLLKKILGAVLIAVSLYFLYVNGKIRMKPDTFTQLSMGTVSGMMGGLFGMQGPPAVIYFLACTDSKEEYMGIAQWYFIIGNVCMTVFRAQNGFLTPDVARLFLCGIPAVLLGLYLGGKVFDRISVDTLRKIVYIYIGIAGAAALIFS